MKKIANNMLVIFLLAICLSISQGTLIVHAGGDSMGGRPEYTVDQINKLYEEGNWNNKVVFNSITDSVIGSEFDFVGAREDTGINAGKDNVWNGRDIVAEDGKTYLVRMYVHNNGKSQENWRETDDSVAKDTRVFFSIPQDSSTRIQVSGFINSSNATPEEYWDSVYFNSDHVFHLEYIRDSAQIANNGVAEGGIALSNDVVDKVEGTLIGYDAMDGRVPGCYEYDNYITIRVKAVFDDNASNDFSSKTTVRKVGNEDEEWLDEINASIGDEVEIQIAYENKSNAEQQHVVIRNVLPSNLEYIPGSTMVWNGNHPNGVTLTTDAIVDGGVDIGSYNAGANAIVRFRAKIVDTDLVDGRNVLVNWGRTSIDDIVLQDYVNIVVFKTGSLGIKISITTLIIIICLVAIFYINRKLKKLKV